MSYDSRNFKAFFENDFKVNEFACRIQKMEKIISEQVHKTG